MDLVNRYLQAVRFWLPKAQKQDIIAELSEDIKSEIDDREAELGRSLSEGELESLLKQRGSPFSVAESFLPQRSLIGPGLYPIYLFVLKVVGLVYLVPWLAVWLFLVVFVPSYRASHPGAALFGTLSTWWNIALYSFAMITLWFAVAERVRRRFNVKGNWNPRRLPAVRDTLKISRANSVAEAVLGLIFLVWWLGQIRFPVIIGNNLRPTGWTPGPIWEGFYHQFYWAIIVLTLASITLAGINFFWPYWSRLRLGARAALDGASAVILFVATVPHYSAFKAQWLTMTGPHPALSNLEGINNWTNLLIFQILLVAGLITLGSCLWRLGRIVRWRSLPRIAGRA